MKTLSSPRPGGSRCSLQRNSDQRRESNQDQMRFVASGKKVHLLFPYDESSF